MNVINIKKGLDIRLVGTADKVLIQAPAAQSYALCPDNYLGLTPKMLVAAGAPVKVGTPLFFDKAHPEVLFTSPVSGIVAEVVRGEKRKILAIVVTPDGAMESESFQCATMDKITEAQVRELLLSSGMWPMIIQRPFGVIADASATPRDIYISGVDSAPLGVDCNFMLENEAENLNAGIALLSKLTVGKVHLTIDATVSSGTLSQIQGACLHYVKGKHPKGNVGVQIAKINPIGKGELVWTVNIQHVAMMGRLALTGKANFEKTVALAGAQVEKPLYLKVITGAAISSLINGKLKPGAARLINGDPLSGKAVSADGYLGFYNNTLSAIAEGDYHEFAGWAMPRFGKFSLSRSYFSWLMPHKKYELDTNLNGGVRAFVMNGIYEKVQPIDIYSVYLMKAIMAGDIDKMEQLGIYEVIEEDVALCEFICPSKIEWQAELRSGINKMIKEL
ncbi:MAG: Na(+)-translocating NADH-quinone reductase subunit A [Mucinivorans sp.]